MALVVETGDIVDGANSYVSLQEGNDYIALNFPSETVWSELTDPEKEALLIRAARFLDSMVKWRSEIKDNYQALAWPRQEFKDAEGRIVLNNSIPTIVKEAQIELAYSLANGEELTTEYEKIEREDFGDTSDVYASPVIRGGNTLVRSLVKSLAYSGYAHNRASIVTVWRA